MSSCSKSKRVLLGPFTSLRIWHVGGVLREDGRLYAFFIRHRIPSYSLDWVGLVESNTDTNTNVI